MNLRKIKALENKAKKEAEKAIKNIYKKYDKEIVSLIKEQLPKESTLISGNGISLLHDKNDNRLLSGNAWSQYDRHDKQLTYLAGLQYNNDFQGGFCIDREIKK